ncbi:hypothetical protein CMEL01_03701 [Colletotrichum melonis]|uniref:Uncharacterized protein n=1 Tax=Colletotrichum melonis TaxID=1209925 RepID=A0AAI9UAV1_9PEZI|nr:hypothetical protein CMEL01_03701 [Colletotrichum melonis]
MASTQHTLEDGPFVPVMSDNPAKSPSTPEVARITAAIMEEKFATLDEREINGRVPDLSIERKKAFGNVIRKSRKKVPKEKLFVLLKIQEPTKRTGSLASSLKSMMTASLGYMGLDSVNLVVVHSNGYLNPKKDLDPEEDFDPREDLGSKEFKEAWAQLREQITAQKDGKRRAHFIGVSSDSETFILVEPSQTPAINYQQATESGGLTTLKQACGLKDGLFVRFADIPSNRTIIQGEEEPLQLSIAELPQDDLLWVLVGRNGTTWQSQFLRRLGIEYSAKHAVLGKVKENKNVGNETKAEKHDMLPPDQLIQQVKKRRAEEDAEKEKQRKQHETEYRKKVLQDEQNSNQATEDKDETEDLEAEQTLWSPAIQQVVENKVKSFFGWVEKPKKA